STLTAETSSIQGTQNQLTVASYKVLNLDPLLEVQSRTSGNQARNVDDDIADGRFAAIAAQIVNNLNSPDIIGLQEIQDNTGGEIVDTIISADVTLQTLITAISNAGGPTYAFIDNTFITDLASGGQPGGNIRTAYLYNPNRVDLLENSIATIGGQGSGEAFEGARLPLVASFEFNGEVITVINNHFSSKGGSAPIFGLEQPFESRQEEVTVNGSLDERQRQSDAVQTFVSNGLAENANANIIVLGDLNEFEFVSPVLELETDAGLNNLTNTLAEDERYSFIFQGNSQSLDHILVSDNLNSIASFDIVHVNSEFEDTDMRASDHDPLLAGFNISGETPSTEVVLSPIQDAFIQGTQGINDNLIRVENGNRVGYLQFSLLGILGEVTAARLEMTQTADPGNGTIQVSFGGNDDWTEFNLDSDNAPDADVFFDAVSGSFDNGQTFSWDLDVATLFDDDG
ncbi:MAG: endonuclease/exonuclease/phosphatase family protein, partial [Bacteroidota bacterium]